jgi:hypothetical protein
MNQNPPALEADKTDYFSEDQEGIGDVNGIILGGNAVDQRRNISVKQILRRHRNQPY